MWPTPPGARWSRNPGCRPEPKATVNPGLQSNLREREKKTLSPMYQISHIHSMAVDLGMDSRDMSLPMSRCCSDLCNSTRFVYILHMLVIMISKIKTGLWGILYCDLATQVTKHWKLVRLRFLWFEINARKKAASYFTLQQFGTGKYNGKKDSN